MEYKIRELDMQALQEEILRKCRKKTKKEPLALSDEMEDDEYKQDVHEKDVVLIETEKTITDEELPFEDILAEKRRKYTTKEEFIYSLYNNILPAFVTE